MSQIFPASANSIARLLIGAGIFALVGGVVALGFVADTSYSNGLGLSTPQPVPFSHQHHVQGLRLDCRFCHQSVENSADAGIPDTATCMGCHSQIWSKAPVLAPVRESLAQNRRLQWWRVNRLPDFVYFNHGAHIQKGVGCVTCHGRVGAMRVVTPVRAFTMKFCIDCHQAPEKNLRPVDEVFNEDWQNPGGLHLAERNGVRALHLKDCVLCHR